MFRPLDCPEYGSPAAEPDGVSVIEKVVNDVNDTGVMSRARRY